MDRVVAPHCPNCPKEKKMDFSNIELEDLKSSYWVHLAIDGHPLYWDEKAASVTTSETDKPCRVKMRSAASNEVYKAFSKYQVADTAFQARIGKARDNEIEAIASKHAEKTESLLDNLIVVAVEDWENIYFDGKAEKVFEPRVRDLIDRHASYSKRQIRTQLFSSIVEKRENLNDAASD